MLILHLYCESQMALIQVRLSIISVQSRQTYKVLTDATRQRPALSQAVRNPALLDLFWTFHDKESCFWESKPILYVILMTNKHESSLKVLLFRAVLVNVWSLLHLGQRLWIWMSWVVSTIDSDARQLLWLVIDEHACKTLICNTHYRLEASRTVVRALQGCQSWLWAMS